MERRVTDVMQLFHLCQRLDTVGWALKSWHTVWPCQL